MSRVIKSDFARGLLVLFGILLASWIVFIGCLALAVWIVKFFFSLVF